MLETELESEFINSGISLATGNSQRVDRHQNRYQHRDDRITDKNNDFLEQRISREEKGEYGGKENQYDGKQSSKDTNAHPRHFIVFQEQLDYRTLSGE